MNMVNRFIFSALLVMAMVTGATAQHNFNLTSLTKGASSSGVLHYTATRPDSVWYFKQMCNDSNFSGTIFSDTVKVRVGAGSFVDTINTLSDTTECWVKMISYRHDTDSARTIIRDTTGFIVLNKVPTLSESLTSTSDSIRYAITVNGGNGNGVMVIITPYIDSMHTMSFCPDTFYVSGSNTVTRNATVRSWLSSCTRYFFETKVVNPISGTVIVNKAKNTACPLVSTPYVGAAGTPVATANTITLPIVMDLYSRNATFRLYWRISSLSYWTDSADIIGLDTTLTGGQYRNPIVSGLLPSTSYTFDVKGKNVIGTSYLGTTVVSTTAPLPVFSLAVSATYMSHHISASIAYSNTPSGHCTFTCGLLHGGSIISSIPFYSLYSASVIDTGFSGISDTGMYGVTVWGYNEVGTYLESDTVWMYVPYIPTTKIADAEKINSNGRIEIYSIAGKFLGTYDCSFNERRKNKINLSNDEIYIFIFRNEDGEIISREKIYFTP